MKMIMHDWEKQPETPATMDKDMIGCRRCGKRVPLKLTPKEDRPGLKIERCERSPLTPGLLERLQIGRSFWGAELEDLVDVLSKVGDHEHIGGSIIDDVGSV